MLNQSDIGRDLAREKLSIADNSEVKLSCNQPVSFRLDGE